MKHMPFLTHDMPGIGGTIKDRLEDFRVEEVPLYEPCGEGTHVYFRVVKAGIPTPAAVDRIARYMSVRPGEIGVAGLKDARAVTTQMMSLEHADPAKLAAYKDSQMQVTWTGRHTNKLRRGHLAANRFVIRVRDVGAGQVDSAQAILDVLARRGVPNCFGLQRFGLRGDTAKLGEAMVKSDAAEFVAIFRGRAQPSDPKDGRAARDAFDIDCLDRALKCWPRHYRDQRRALSAYKKKHSASAAIRAIDKRMRRFYISAFQSLIFNEVLTHRIETIDRVVVGDLAEKMDSGGIFTVEDAEAEQARADAFEISPTGPIVGYRGSLATGLPGEAERAAMEEHGITQEDFRHVGAAKAKGSRRALRAKIDDLSVQAGEDEHGQYLQVGLALPSGCYATTVLREVMKTE